MTIAIGIILAYLIGSISTSILTAKIMKLEDPRTKGSGNAGATNMLRLAGKKAGAIVFAGDAVKGLVAVLIGRLLGVHAIGLALIAFAAVVGHVFPIYFNFKGGKGVATMIGALLGLSLWLGLATIGVWVVVALLSRYASLASLVAAVAAILFALLFSFHGYIIPLMFIAILVVWKHMENIERLRKGEESKINLKKAKS